MAALSLVAVLVVAGCGDSSSDHPPAATTGATAGTKSIAITPEGLRQLAVRLGQPIYWVGPAPNTAYRRAVSGNGRIIVRYVPSGAEATSNAPTLTVATFRLADGYAATQLAAGEAGAVRLDAPSGAIAFSTKAHPLNAWLSYAGSRYQIEVFAPTPGLARRLVSSGRVALVPGSPRETPRPALVSPEQLASLATDAHPIYWAGEQATGTYELTTMRQGGYMVRYLPKGSVAGDRAPQLTVGTYPMKRPLDAVKRLGRAAGASTIKLAGGGLAVLDPKFPKSVYLAFPNSSVEVEVFDPSLRHARQLVVSGAITRVP
jgi:hypothetical protein